MSRRHPMTKEETKKLAEVLRDAPQSTSYGDGCPEHTKEDDPGVEAGLQAPLDAHVGIATSSNARTLLPRVSRLSSNETKMNIFNTMEKIELHADLCGVKLYGHLAISKALTEDHIDRELLTKEIARRLAQSLDSHIKHALYLGTVEMLKRKEEKI
jgi:hypothetical protein